MIKIINYLYELPIWWDKQMVIGWHQCTGHRVDKVDEIGPLLSEESAQITKATVLDDDKQFAITGNSFCTSTEQIDDVHVRSEVNENF